MALRAFFGRTAVTASGFLGRIVGFITVLVLFAALATVTLCARSYRVADEFVRSRGGIRYEAFTHDGTLTMWRLTDRDDTQDPLVAYGNFVEDQIGNWPSEEVPAYGHFRLDGPTRAYFDANAFLQARAAPTATWQAGRFGFVASTHDFADKFSVRRLDLRLWPIAVVLALPALARLPGLLRRWRRLRTGRCVECGYDLRATTSGRCPECGAAMVSTQSARAETV